VTQNKLDNSSVDIFEDKRMESYFNLDCDEVISIKNKYKPPLKKQPEKLIFLIESKIIALDIILPVAMEIRNENPSVNIEFVFLRKDYLEDIKKNYILWNGMKKTGKITFLLYGGNRKSTIYEKVRTCLKLISNLLKIGRTEVILFYRRDLSSIFLAFLALAVRYKSGAIIGYSKIAYPISKTLHISLLKQEPFAVHHRFQADRHFIFHPLQKEEQKRFTSAPSVTIGTPRFFSVWQSYLDNILENDGIYNIQNEKIDTQSKKILTIFYPGNHDLPDLENASSCRDQFILSLKVINDRYQNKLKVIIKPHVICNLTELKSDLDEFRALDVELTYAHPQLLAKLSIGCIVPNGTSVIDDMYLEGIPVLETSLYKKDIRDNGRSLFPNAGRIECLDEEQLNKAINNLLYEPDLLNSPETNHLYWPKVHRISELLWEN
jgi:hypothetical protein